MGQRNGNRLKFRQRQRWRGMPRGRWRLLNKKAAAKTRETELKTIVSVH